VFHVSIWGGGLELCLGGLIPPPRGDGTGTILKTKQNVL